MATISKSGISPLQQIKAEHLTRIIDALSGETPNIDIIISGSVTASHFVGDGSQLTGIPTGSGGSQNLQQVLDEGNNSTTSLIIGTGVLEGIEINDSSISMYESGNINNQFNISSTGFSSSNTSGSIISSVSFNLVSRDPQINLLNSIKGNTTIKQNNNQSGSILIQYPSQSGTLYIQPYKVYTALLTQSGTDAPVATVLENTLGDISFSYDTVGSYHITSDSLFIEDKTAVTIGNSYSDISTSAKLVNNNTININTGKIDTNVLLQNDNLYNNLIEIRVYN